MPEEVNETPTFGFDDFKAFAESNEDAQKFLQSQSQSAADKQLEAWKSNNLEKIKQDTIKAYEDSKKNLTPEQKELADLKAKFEASEAKSRSNENKAYVAEQIAGLELDKDIKDTVSQFMLTNLVSSDTDFTQNAVEAFTGVLSTISEKHAEAIKSMEMSNAFGNKGNQQQTNKNDDEPIDNHASLQQGLSKLLRQ
ncbi:DUF4355 domain-containing protein [Vagococcus carniphilus]|uniref:capsid assembly scaffolding protein Gp46 family protein n=1 Tax=Vagococcus carniphilus TaxID=218144 RepID=UPI002890F39C|nr:DUF4355 domain-containing protein [Vagococcus carniphilus]MDT2832256.1 DUF4355 domain-containing protein [Vagococcus carniphilus]MDT2840750.1 DUF4355 domain-containing protein [Vagococcus carniphilus]MDT2855729.1 DUF4355 domain-containing protein [Vagococcus carniphilus]